MKTKLLLVLVFQFLCLFSNVANAKTITNVIIFGDSLSDRGTTQYGGFNRYSNGRVWPEYLTASLCNTCLEDYAWGGAKSDNTNYNGLNWSGLLWQVDQYKPNSDPKKSLYIIWIGGNDLINGDKEGAPIAKNIDTAINKLVLKGAKNIVVLTLPDFTLVPAYNDKHLPEYNKFFPVAANVKKQIMAYNAALKQLIPQKNKEFTKIQVHLNYIDLTELFDTIIENNAYNNTMNPWLGTYKYPSNDGYMWWDAWHPMTSVHASIADHVSQVLKQLDYNLTS